MAQPLATSSRSRTMSLSRQHVISLVGILLLVAAAYGPVSDANYCSFDDFDEVHRAAFIDAERPSLIFTTSHFDTYKYRPLNRGMNYATFLADDGGPAAFRIRNLLFHLANVALVCFLATLLLHSPGVGLISALLFGLHPMANQSVIGAVMTNTMAYTAYLAALVMFFASIQSRRAPRLWMTAALISAAIGLWTYDSNIVVFALPVIFIAMWWILKREWPIDRKLAVFAIAGSALVVGSYMLVRMIVIPAGFSEVSSDAPSVLGMLKSLVMYIGALVSPVDSVLAHAWFGTPLPPDLMSAPSALAVLAGLALLSGVALAIWLWRWSSAHRDTLRRAEWPSVVFLTIGLVLPLAPVLVFSSHASETYLYPSAAFFSILMAYAGVTLAATYSRGGQRLFAASLIVLVVLFGAAVLARNQRVEQCGVIANQIVKALLQQRPASGDWSVVLASTSDDLPTPYGYYRFQGLTTIGDGPTASRAMTHALQLATRSRTLTARVVSLTELTARCTTAQASAPSMEKCFLVTPDGNLESPAAVLVAR